ncbi:FAD-dependent monooxygenase [Vibrio lentus]|uniref:FAD-dependent monooxygenase n=1 Tax=Vibrio lentus TaxID=136468 RepID=UPI000C852050|nr:FAD-dependent monooxygenase [Vibrio lentus]PMJ04511.1 hypothetical protein BCU32_03130 [Vibrio lentus]
MNKIAVIGCGISGMIFSLLMAKKGLKVKLYEKSDGIINGSRAITYSQRTMEIFEEIECEDVVSLNSCKWQVAREYYNAKTIRKKNVVPNKANVKYDSFYSQSQSIVHDRLLNRIKKENLICLNLNSEVNSIKSEKGVYVLDVNGEKEIFDFVIAADGPNGICKEFCNYSFKGERFDDSFLICDFKTAQELNEDREAWFDPPEHDGNLILKLKQPENTYRIDFHMRNETEVKNLNDDTVKAMVENFLGVDIELKWWSVYKFRNARLEKFSLNRSLFFIGDSAHIVAPFGGRGANSAIEDAYNLSWKLKEYINDKRRKDLIDSYSYEREESADINISYVKNASKYIIPKELSESLLRRAVLSLSHKSKSAKSLLDSGVMYNPSEYKKSYSCDSKVNYFQVDRLRYIPDFRLSENFYLYDNLVSGEYNEIRFEDYVENGVSILEKMLYEKGFLDVNHSSMNECIKGILIRPDKYIESLVF